KREEWDEFDARIAALSQSGFGSFVAPVVDAWGLAARGQENDARALLAATPPDNFARTYWAEHLGHIALAAGDPSAAVDAYRLLVVDDEGRNTRIRIALADALRQMNDLDAANEVLADARPLPDIIAARNDLAAGKELSGTPTTAEAGVATLLLRVAADLSRERTVPLALTFSRAATWLAPDDASGWLMVSQLLARAEQYDGALDAATNVSPSDPAASLARAQQAALLDALERDEEALGLLEQVASVETATFQDFVQLGEAYQGAERYDDAIEAYRRALNLAEDGNADGRWQAWFLLGAAEEARGDWAAAEAALRNSLAISADQAITLNYLGYMLLERGLKQEEAVGLIERASELRPNDGHITDSLGWAQYQVGDYEAAVATLERAIADVPDDPTINDHLGDAYWQTGRRIEARFRWRAALDADPEDEQRARLAAKLTYGYDRALAMDAASGTTSQP
ncbi:MAG: tetratricopeptide repeat protein, partial [Pacificimonas sp.]